MNLWENGTSKVVLTCLVAGAWSVTACGDDGGPSDDAQAVCELQEKHDAATWPKLMQDEGAEWDMRVDEDWLRDFQALTPPSGIADDWETLSSSYTAYAEAADNIDVDALRAQLEGFEPSEEGAVDGDGDDDDGESLEDLMDDMVGNEATQAMAILGTEEYQEADVNVTNYIYEECGLG